MSWMRTKAKNERGLVWQHGKRFESLRAIWWHKVIKSAGKIDGLWLTLGEVSLLGLFDDEFDADCLAQSERSHVHRKHSVHTTQQTLYTDIPRLAESPPGMAWNLLSVSVCASNTASCSLMQTNAYRKYYTNKLVGNVACDC